MARKRYTEHLNRILRHPGLNPDDFLIIIEHRGASHDLKVLRASQVAHASHGALILHQGTQIPLHHVVQIRNRLTGEILAGEELELDEEAQEDLLEEQPTAEVGPFSLEPTQAPQPGSQPRFREITVAVRAAYPEEGEYDWTESLLPLIEVGEVEVAFHKTSLFLDKVEIHDVVAPFSKLRLKVGSIHMAHAKITKPETFMAVVEKTVQIAGALDCPLIVVHPSYCSKGGLREVNDFLTQRIDPLLKGANVTLCWETFSGKKRFLSGIESIAAFCRGEWHAACYDTSHLHKPQEEVIADIKAYAPIIKVFHLSNRSGAMQHLPLRHPEGELEFATILKAIITSDFSGSITLEYLKEYHDHLLEDVHWVKRLLEGSCLI